MDMAKGRAYLQRILSMGTVLLNTVGDSESSNTLL
jgi:hypothetical protein